MNDLELESDLTEAARQVHELSRKVTLNPQHKARLREELMRRHQELTSEHTQRAVGKLWPRFSGLKRLTLVAPPALAVALALTIALWSLQISGHEKPQSAEAALTKAFAQTAGRVTGWEWTLHQHVAGKSPAVYRYAGRLTPQQQLYISSGTTYLQSGSRIFRVTSQALMSTSPRPGPAASYDLGWAFATLPNTLLSPRITFVSPAKIAGLTLQGVRYGIGATSGPSATITAWLNPENGLLMRLKRTVTSNQKVLETDVVDYGYTVSQ